MIEARGLTKRYGAKTAVEDLSFTVRPGIVTGFLGPNGAGKSTTMRMIAGLDEPTTGSVTVNGRSYRDAVAPMAELGLLLEARAVHTSRSAFNHLLALAQTNGVPRHRVDELIEAVGLTEVARKRVGGFSLGMGQRLGVASALLGDPETIVLDEPVNGLDPEGILWIRNLLKGLAAEGRTVFVSSHLMSEMALTAQHLIVIGRGRLIADTSVDEIVAQASGAVVRVRTPQATELRDLLIAPDRGLNGVAVSVGAEPGLLDITGMTAAEVGQLALDHRILLHELSTQRASLEEAFMELTRDSVEFATHAPALAQAGEAR
jgi:ABC-2 type transport system ATP-binding protein